MKRQNKTALDVKVLGISVLGGVVLLTAGSSVIAQNAKQAGSIPNNLGIPVAPLNFGKQTSEAPKPLKLPATGKTTPKQNAKAAMTKPAAHPAVTVTPSKTNTKPSEAAASPALTETKPSIATPIAGATSKFGTLDSPKAAVGDSGRMLFFLVPILLVTYGALKLLQRYQQKTGRLPAALQNAAKTQPAQKSKSGSVLSAILGSFALNNARERGGSSIRVVESVPVGGVNIHLVEVRGRLLLLGGSGGNVNLLTEFQGSEIDGGDFRALLNAAAAEMDGLTDDYALPTSAVVGGIEDDLRGTGEAMQKRLRRLRTVQEAEENPDWMRMEDARY